MGQYGMNGHFVPNMTGRRVRFDVQPYTHGVGIIARITPRVIRTTTWLPDKGHANIEYETFDLDITVEEGKHCGGFYCGVPVTGWDIAGKTERLTGVSLGEIVEAVNNDRAIVIARCG